MTNLAKFLDHNYFEPYDVLFRNFFEKDTTFLPLLYAKSSYPADVYEDEKSITIEVAAVGLNKEDINIEEEDGVLTVSYDKQEKLINEWNTPELRDKRHCIQHGITRKSFNLNWKFSDKFDLKNINAQLEKGILKISVPKNEEKPALPKNTIKIK
jgi:HSP20 family protein